jgi:hypothetical protein
VQIRVRLVRAVYHIELCRVYLTACSSFRCTCFKDATESAFLRSMLRSSAEGEDRGKMRGVDAIWIVRDNAASLVCVVFRRCTAAKQSTVNHTQLKSPSSFLLSAMPSSDAILSVEYCTRWMECVRRFPKTVLEVLTWQPSPRLPVTSQLTAQCTDSAYLDFLCVLEVSEDNLFSRPG